MKTLQTVYCKNGDILEVMRSLSPLTNKLYETRDQITFGRLFADTFKSVLKYNVTSKQWYIYDGIVWKEDTGGVITGRLAETFQRVLKIYLAESVSGNETQFETDYQKFALRLGDRQKRLCMIEDAKHHTNVKMEDFDRDKNLLNVQNGVINLKTFELLEHDPDMLLSKVCNVSYNPEASSLMWEKFLNDVFEGDQQKIEYLQRLFGYALTGDSQYEECYLLYGKTTRNGKSTLLRTFETMMGSYGLSIKPESLAQRKTDGRTANGDIARLKGCRFLHCSEPQKGMILDVSLLKTLTGRDIITARNLYEREFQFTPVFKLFFNSNYLPTVTDMTLFGSNRIKVIEFNRHFTEQERDVHLKDKLESPENQSAILNWSLEGLKRFYELGTVPPESVRHSTEEYKKQSDKIQNFITDCLCESPTANLSLSDLYLTYTKWCSANGFRAEGKKNFREVFTAKLPLAESGTVMGKTVRNVLLNHTLSEEGMDIKYPYRS